MSLKESLSNCARAISNFFRACFCWGERRNNENNAHERQSLIPAVASAPQIEIIDLSDVDPASARLILTLMDENPARVVSHHRDSEQKIPSEVEDTANDESFARALARQDEEDMRSSGRPPARLHSSRPAPFAPHPEEKRVTGRQSTTIDSRFPGTGFKLGNN